MGYRHTAVFCADWRPHSRIIDRNERAKILALAEALERRSKAPGRRNGVLGYVGLAVLRTLLLTFLSPKTGLCCPSYVTLQQRTGLCRQSIANGLARLERTGIIRVMRRLVRAQITRTNGITGQIEAIVTTTQATSLYSMFRPGAWADHLQRQTSKAAPFPAKRQLELLKSAALHWKVQPSLSGRENPQHPVKIIARVMQGKEVRGFSR